MRFNAIYATQIRNTTRLCGCLVTLSCLASQALANDDSATAIQKIAPPPPAANSIRIATFNVALNRKKAGELSDDLRKGDEQAKRIATIVQLVQPDVLLTNEVDYDDGVSAKLLRDEYFNKRQKNQTTAPKFSLPYMFTGPVNTGVDSGLDLNLNNRLHESDDGWGYGAFPGQYGMVVYSRFPIDEASVRTFQKFQWSKMPDALRPKNPGKDGNESSNYHDDQVWNQLRLSSKSHWDVPVRIGDKTLHVIASHPTPPVFDGPEDRNGCRNHDEIRMIRDYVSGEAAAEYLIDDSGRKGPLPSTETFVILGDLNSDPLDGSGVATGIQSLLDHPRVNSRFIPRSEGAIEAAKVQGKANDKHKGDPAVDTGDFNDNSAGNLRIDFVLPSNNCTVVAGGVFWPTTKDLRGIDPELVNSSDHHLVWLDIHIGTPVPNPKP